MSFFDFVNVLKKNPKGASYSAPAQLATGGASGKVYDFVSGLYNGLKSGDTNVLGVGTNSPNAVGGAAQDPYSDLRSQIQGKFNALNDVFSSLYGDIDNVVKDRVNQLNQNYDTQIGDVNKAYSKGAEQQANMYGARGLGSSSYATNAQQDLTDTYNQQLNDLNSGRQNNLSQLGQYAASTKAGFDTSKNAFGDAMSHLGDYSGDALSSLLGQINSALTSAQQQRAGLGTNQQFIEGLNKITPVQQSFTNQLASKLQNLITSSAPVYAKKQIAQGLIRQANLNDQNAQSYWNDYFNKMLTDNGVA